MGEFLSGIIGLTLIGLVGLFLHDCAHRIHDYEQSISRMEQAKEQKECSDG